MPRAALLVGRSAGDAAAEALASIGFGAIESADSVDAALQQLHTALFDVVVLPMQTTTPEQLLQLDAERQRIAAAGGELHVIGTAPEPGPDLLLRAMRAGIQEFLVYPPNASELCTAVDRLVRRASPRGARGELLAVFSAKGGLGCTSIAVNLAAAVASARPDARVAIADLVVADGDVRLFLNVAGGYHLGDLAGKLDRADGNLMNALLTPSHGVWVLPSPEDAEMDDVLDAATMGRMFEQLRAHFSLTVLDCEHHMTARTIAALDAADRILLVTQLNVAALRSAQRTLALFRQLGYPDEKVAVVVNRYQRGELLGRRDAAAALTREVFHSLPNDYALANGALTKGMPMSAFSAGSKLAGAYAELASKLPHPAVEGEGAGSAEHAPTPHSLDKSFSRLFGRLKRA